MDSGGRKYVVEVRRSSKGRRDRVIALLSHGNSLTLVIDRPILDLLKIDTDTPLEISTDDGTRLIVAPAAAPLARREKFDAAQEWAHKRYGKAFEKLAK